MEKFENFKKFVLDDSDSTNKMRQMIQIVEEFVVEFGSWVDKINDPSYRADIEIDFPNFVQKLKGKDILKNSLCEVQRRALFTRIIFLINNVDQWSFDSLVEKIEEI